MAVEPTSSTHSWEAAAQVVLALGEQLTEDGLAERGIDQALIVFAADATALYLLDSASLVLDLKAQRGFAPETVEQIVRLPLDLPCLVTRAALAAELESIDAPSGLSWEAIFGRDLPDGRHFRCVSALPLKAHGQLVGVLVYAKRSKWRAQHSATANVIAHALASGFLNARTLEEERRTRRALEAVDEATLAIASELEPSRVLQAIVDRARDVAGARYAALGIGNDPSRSFEPWVFSGVDEATAKLIGPHPRPHGLLGAVVTEGTAIRVANMPEDPRYRGFPAHHPPMRSFMGVPIRARGKTVGNLYLADKVGAAEFSAEDQRAAESLAAHAAIAFIHAQLFEQAQAERGRLRTVLESSPIGIVFVDKQTGQTVANPAAEQLFGRAISPHGGREQYYALFATPDGSDISFEDLPSSRALRGESVIGVELIVRRDDGREVPVLVNAATIRGPHGQISGAVVLWQDISPLKLERLREEFISVVAHELRAPITVIAGYADLWQRKVQDAQERRAIESIRISARRLERLVQDLLDASRIEAQRLELERRPVDIAVLVREVVERLGEVLHRRTVETSVADQVELVEADIGRIEQVLTNLLTNAAKYSPDETPIQVTVAQQDGEVVVSVINEGAPIPANDLPRLFTRYYRTMSARRGRAQGMGLGLYIARGLVEAHGGRIWATSEQGKGTVFSFALPALASVQQASS